MRVFLLSTVVACTLGLLSASATMAAPAAGTAINDAAQLLSPVQDTACFIRRRHAYGWGRWHFVHRGRC